MLGVWTDEKQRCDLSQPGKCWQTGRWYSGITLTAYEVANSANQRQRFDFSLLHQINPYIMKQVYENENLIFLPFAILAAIVLCFAIWAVIKFRKLYENKNQTRRVANDDSLPGRYEDIQCSEQPYYEYFN
jgi:hypothetical protein